MSETKTFVPTDQRLDFMEELSQADNDARTTGFFLMMIAPRRDGYAREGVLCVGDLPFDAIMEHIIKQASQNLIQHNAQRGTA